MPTQSKLPVQPYSSNIAKATSLLGTPEKFIYLLDAMGEELRKNVKAQFNIVTRQSSNKINWGMSGTFIDLARQDSHLPSIELNDDQAHAFHAFMTCWKDDAKNDPKKKGEKLKAGINTRNRHNIHLALAYLEQAYSYNPKLMRFKSREDAKSREEAAKLLRDTTRAISEFEITSQSIFKRIGQAFGVVFALTQGFSNGKSMGASIIAISALLGIGGLALSAPYILIPAVIIGGGSLIINALIAIPAAGKTFVDFFGKDSLLEGLFSYRDKDGNKLYFTRMQMLGFVFGGMLPALFSATVLAILGGFVLQMTLVAMGLTAIAAPLAYFSIVSCGLALFAVYMKDMATLFHFDANVKGMDAVKAYFKQFLMPTALMNGFIEGKVSKMRATLLKDANLDEANREQILEEYKSRLTNKSRVLAAFFIPLALAGIGLTLFGGAVATPQIFPAINFSAALVIAAIAQWGQTPFYGASAAKFSAKIMNQFTKEPKEVQDIELGLKETAAASQSDAVPLLNDDELVDGSKKTDASYHDILREVDQAHFESLSPTEKILANTKATLTRAASTTKEIAKSLNPPANGAIAFVSVDFFGAIANAIMKPVTFLLASFASGAISYSVDSPEASTDNDEMLYAKLFRSLRNSSAAETTADDSIFAAKPGHDDSASQDRADTLQNQKRSFTGRSSSDDGFFSERNQGLSVINPIDSANVITPQAQVAQ